MAYVNGSAHHAECVFCSAASSNDDAGSLVLHRGQHCFVIMNLYPYNTGHLMVVPYDHADDPAGLDPSARAEMAELSASFCTGLKLVMGCDGMNVGMNLGAVAGAGIADHVHQHIVPRWRGDANFMPIIGGTKVLPELIPATYGKLRAELVRKKSENPRLKLVLVDSNWSGLYLASKRLPDIPTVDADTAWKAASTHLSSMVSSASLVGWAGAASTHKDSLAQAALLFLVTPRTGQGNLKLHPWESLEGQLPDEDYTLIEAAVDRFSPPTG